MIRIEPVPEPNRIITYWKKEKLTVAAIVVFGLAFNISMPLGSVWQGKLIDAIAFGSPFQEILKAALSFVLLILTIQTLRYFKRFFIRRFANSTSASMRLVIYNNIMRKRMPEIETEDAGNLMTRAISDVDLCVEGMRKFTTELFDTGVLMISYLVSLLIYDVKLTLLSVIFIPLAMLLAEKLKGIISGYAGAWREKSSEIAVLTYETLENILLYRIRGISDVNANRYAREVEDLQKKAVRANLLENSMQPVYNAIAMLGVVIVIIGAGKRVIAGVWSVGEFSAYLTIFVAMAFKSSKASKLFNSVQKSQVSWRRIRPWLTPYRDYDGEPEASAREKPKTTSPLLEVSNLAFRFTGAKTNAIAGISFKGEAGQLIGITGPVGCGKTALGLALTGLYPYEGSVRIAGNELSDLNGRMCNSVISYMGHQPELLSDSIRTNILLGTKIDQRTDTVIEIKENTNDAVASVLEDVYFDTDLKGMPDGADTFVGSGGIRLSGGQQSRIALARTLFGNKHIIILDDPFSAVDVRTEELILARLRQRYKDSLVILISHRLTAFPQADRIMLLCGTGCMAYGTHDELMANSALYAEIFRFQHTEAGGAV